VVFPALAAAEETLSGLLSAIAVMAKAGEAHCGLGPVSQGNLNHLLLAFCGFIYRVWMCHVGFL